MFSVLKRSKACMLFKFPEKISQIVEAAVQTYVHNGGVCGLEENDRLFDSIFVYVSYRGFPQNFFKKNGRNIVRSYLHFPPDPGYRFFPGNDSGQNPVRIL